MITRNISLNKEPIELECGIKYIIIDALYLNDIRQGLSCLNNNNISDEIRSKVFPYTDTPFAEYTPTTDIFTLNQIKKIDYGQLESVDKSILSTDSGVLIFINEKILIDFVSKYDYGEFVNSETELLNLDYWSSIVNNYNMQEIAVIVSPGINSGVEFDGSGSYRIQ